MMKETYHLTDMKASIFFVSLLDLRMKSNAHLTDVLPFLCCALITGFCWHFSPSRVFGGFFVSVKMKLSETSASEINAHTQATKTVFIL